jgi:DNA-binding transcriptional ArsR family regulator
MRVPDMSAENTVEFLKILAHPVRLKIIECLKGKEKTVNDIQTELRKSQSTISQHLKVLFSANILTFRKDGLKSYYKIADTKIHDILLNINQYIADRSQHKIEDITATSITDTLY